MALVPLFPRVIDNTMRSDFVSCPHKFFDRHILGVTRPGISVHLHFGSCYADALKVARTYYFHHRDPRDAVVLAMETAIEKWGNFDGPPTPSQSEAKKTLPSLLLAVQDYFREWPLDEDDLIIDTLPNGSPCVECSFAVPIPGSRHPDTGEPILYAGRFDMIGRRLGKRWGLDDKTTSALGEGWRKQWRLRAQFTGYCFGAREYGFSLDGFLVRGCAPLKERTSFDEAIAARPSWMIDTWLQQLCADVNSMVDCYEEYRDHQVGFGLGHPFAQNLDHSCSDFGGCQFLDLCASEHPDVWLPENEDDRSTDFIVDRWNPLTRRD